MRTISKTRVNLPNGTYKGFWFDTQVSIPLVDEDVEFIVADRMHGKGHDVIVYIQDETAQVEIVK